MSKQLITILALIFLIVSVSAQKKAEPDKAENTGIIYGNNHSYKLTAPKDWLLDNKSGVSQGLHAVFYPQDSSWRDGIAVMYTNVSQKMNKAESAKETIERDIANFKKGSPKLKVEDAKSIKLTKDKSATIKYFSNDENGNYEAIAYIDEAKVVVMIVLTSKTKKDFDASLVAFQELVGSYFFLTDKVNKEATR